MFNFYNFQLIILYTCIIVVYWLFSSFGGYVLHVDSECDEILMEGLFWYIGIVKANGGSKLSVDKAFE